MAGKQERATTGQGPQELLVQGAVEAVNLLLAVFPDVVQGGPAAYNLQHIAARSRGAWAAFGVQSPASPLPYSPRPVPVARPAPLPKLLSVAGLATSLPALKTARISRHQILDQEERVEDCGAGGRSEGGDISFWPEKQRMEGRKERGEDRGRSGG